MNFWLNLSETSRCRGNIARISALHGMKATRATLTCDTQSHSSGAICQTQFAQGPAVSIMLLTSLRVNLAHNEARPGNNHSQRTYLQKILNLQRRIGN